MKTKTYLGTLAVLGLLTWQAGAQMTVDSVLTNGLFEPYSVAVDTDNLVYVADSSNHRIARFNPSSGSVVTLAGTPGVPGTNDGPSYLAHFSSPQGIVLGSLNGTPGVFVADTGNHTIRFVNRTNGFVTTLAGLGGTMGGTNNATGANARFRFPIGLSLDSANILYIADSKNNAIRQIDLADPSFTVTLLGVTGTTFREPNAVAAASTSLLWVADTRNHAVKLVSRTGPGSAVVTTIIGSNDQNVSGFADNDYGGFVRFNNPRGLLWLGNAGLIIADTGNQIIRLATNNPAFGFGATNYGVVTIAGVPTQSGMVNGPALASKFAGPHGLGRDLLGNGIILADTANSAIRRLQIGPTPPPVADPQIGWIDFVVDPVTGTESSILRTDQPFVFNNDQKIAILPEAATETFFTFGPTPASPLEDNIPSPATPGSDRHQPPAYRNGLTRAAVSLIPSIIQPQLDVTVKAIGTQDGRRNSSVVAARFQYKVATPGITGDNAALFVVDDITDNSTLWYTLDGSEPTNQPPSINGGLMPAQLSLSFTNGDFLFRARAFRSGYTPSGVAQKVFSITNYVPHRISFGFDAGEASSEFVASAGQIFYAPVTLALIPDSDVNIYGLQFNATVASLTGPPVAPGAVEFTSMLQEQVISVLGTRLPPGAQQWYRTIPTMAFDHFETNDLFIISQIFTNLLFTNSVTGSNSILMGIGWLERWGHKNLYDTFAQDLIKYSIAHDTLFLKANKRVVLGAYGFQVPANARNGDTYQIDLDRPSANSDGVGAPGSDVFIDAPKIGSLGGGSINARKRVTVGQRRYVVGDVAPFRWLNAGDFGNNSILNDDVMQVFERAVYNLEPNDPPRSSDLFDAMDACCASGVTNANTVYQVGGSTNLLPLGIFNGDDSSINYYPFGDGKIDVTDVFVSFRRALDCSLTWWQRFHTTNGLAAETVANQFRGDTNCPITTPAPAPAPPPQLSTATAPEVKFTVGDGISAPGQTVFVPVNARIHGDYPLRVLALGITVQPLDGSPEITVPIQFSPISQLGSPSVTGSRGPANYAGAWLNNNIAGLLGDVQIGLLSITLPTNCTANSAYAIHFDHASASPNGLGSFPRTVWTGIISCTNRSGSSLNDSIPDAWRLRYFGSAYNLLSQANADADGDGANNWQEFKAGTNPNDSTSSLRVKSSKGLGQALSVHWPSVLNKQYVIERASSIYSPAWTSISTNNGTGWDMEFQDNNPGGGARFYRVRLLE